MIPRLLSVFLELGMQFFQKSLIVVGVGLLLAGGTVGVFAQEDKSAILKTRQDFMNAQQKAFGAISAFGKGTGERQAAVDGVNRLVEMSTELQAKFVAFFPAGTSNVEFPGKTLAKPEMWQGTNFDQARSGISKLHDAEVKLVDVVKTADPETVGKAASDVYRGSCNGLCHNSYRAPEEKK
jgi:cytochrome c556